MLAYQVSIEIRTHLPFLPPIPTAHIPASSAAGAAIGSPDTIILRANFSPTSLGSRCVPPAPGTMPSFTSGSPKRLPASATR